MQATSLQVIRMITAAVCRNCKGSGGCRSHPYLSHTNIAKSANFVSDYQHSIAKGEETVLLCHSYLIGVHGLFVAVQGGHQHDQGALRQMEVGDQTVDAVELHPRVQEDGGVAAASLDLAVLGSGSSSVRQLVVPTAMTRWPAALVSRMRRAVSSLMEYHSLCILWSEISSSCTGRKVPRPTCRVTSQCRPPWRGWCPSAPG